MDRDELIAKVKSYETESRFLHTMRMTEMAVYLAKIYGVDTELTWMTGMVHDVAKNMSWDEMLEVAERYGHTVSEFSKKFPENMHAEIGALIAEHEFGFQDRDAINAIKYHYTCRPDMSMIEKIICFADRTEPGRPNYPETHYLYEVAKTDLDLAVLRLLKMVVEYQQQYSYPEELQERFNYTFDYLIDQLISRNNSSKNTMLDAALFSDDEFDDALNVCMMNAISVKSVENIRSLGGFVSKDGRTLKSDVLIRSGALSKITEEEAAYLREEKNLSLIIDLRTPEECEKKPDKVIPGVRYENIPLSSSLSMERLEELTERYQKSETKKEKAWFLSKYAGVEEVRKMYRDIAVNPYSKEVIRRIFKLILNEKGTVLFHCTSGKDRTGVLAILILKALGCRDDDIIRDYTASAVAFFSMAELFGNELRKNGYSAELYTKLQTTLSVVPEVVVTALHNIFVNYDSDDAFLKNATGFDSNELEAFRNKYLVGEKTKEMPDSTVKSGELEIDATEDNLGEIKNFTDKYLKEAGCSDETEMQLQIAIEEIFVNIACYAYGDETGKAVLRIKIKTDPEAIVFTFIDQGIKYNPLLKEDPDIYQPAGKRQIGGLGIFMAKKIMDYSAYAYQDGSNILTLMKYI